MLRPSYTKKFEKDVKQCKKRRLETSKLRHVMERLINREPLPIKYRDHKLLGYYVDCRECHVEPDWLLVYRIVGDEIYFEATGTHSDLFR